MPPVLAQIQIAHKGEVALLILVVVAVLVGLFFLMRIVLRGSKGLGDYHLPSKPYRRVLLPASAEMGYTNESVTLACRLAGSGGNSSVTDSKVVLSYVIEVPRALAPNAEMPEEEAEATRILNAAAEGVRACGMTPVTQIRKARVALDETLRAIQEENVDVIVLPVTGKAPTESELPHPAASISRELTRRAPCEVVVARSVGATPTG